MKIIIIGGVAGGATTAARLRRLNESAEITLIERGEHISYANCGLPYYIGGSIAEREQLFVQTPEFFSRRFNIEVLVGHEASSIDPKQKIIQLKQLNTGQSFQRSYDKLLLSPGAEPVRPKLPGIDLPNIFTLRNVKNTDTIKSFIQEKRPQKALVIGAGYIGLEMAENLHALGMMVTIVEMAQQVMTPLDYEMAAEVHQHLKRKQIEFYLGDGVLGFEEHNNQLEIKLKSGRSLHCDMVILSIGVRPESSLALSAGIKTGDRGGILVDKYLETSVKDIYAVGDAIEFPHPITGTSVTTYLAGPANKQARIAADNIIRGNTKTYKGSIQTAIAKVFDLTVASTGLSEKALKKEGLQYFSNLTHGSSHAGYYPDATPLSIKLVFSPEGKVYGAQVIGFDGVDKRIDLIAAVLRQGGNIYDLQEIEQAYAPPYSSAKDPVNIAGFAAENIINKTVRISHWDELSHQNSEDWVYLSIMTKDEHQIGHIEGSVNIPLDGLRERLSELPKEKNILVYCAVGLRGYVACRILEQSGFDQVYNLSGGYHTYKYAIQKQSNEGIFSKNFIDKDDVIYQTNPHEKNTDDKKTIEVNACGLQCPGPIMRLKKELEQIEAGERIREIASDPGFYTDVESWCRMTGNKLIERSTDKNKVIAVIEKSAKAPTQRSGHSVKDAQTIVVFSGDFDKALAAFVIANGAASTGRPVTLFFTFWGLTILRKKKAPKVKKDFMGKAFSKMLPKGSGELQLSAMKMAGMGSPMMRKRMKSLNIDSLEQMIKTAQENKVRFIACQMSMDVMGIKKEELLDGVEIGGVATYLDYADQAHHNLFI